MKGGSILNVLIKGLAARPWKWLLGALILTGLYVAVDITVGWQQTLNLWNRAEPVNLIGAFILYALSHVIRSWRALRLMNAANRIALTSFIKISALHQLGNNFLPMRLGEFIFPFLLNRYYAISWGKGISKLIWLRVFDAIVIGTVILLILLFSVTTTLMMIAILGGTVFLLLTYVYRKPLLKLARKFGADHLIKAAPASRKEAWVLFLMSMVTWIVKLSAFVLVILALADIKLVHALSGALAAEISSLLPIHGIAGTGSFEASYLLGSMIWEAFDEGDLAVAVNLHIFVLCSSTLVAGLTLPLKFDRKKRDEANVRIENC